MAKRGVVMNGDSVRAVLENHESVSHEQVAQAVSDPIEQARLIAGINNALIEIQDHETSPEVLSSPPSKIASQLQTFLAEQAAREGKAVARELPGGAIEAKFDKGDWKGWAFSFFSWAGGIIDAKWIKAPPDPEPMPDNARVALLADWATGLYGAPPAAKCISATKPAFSHVIHLGDVYYSGTTSEIDERMMAFWPNINGARRLACNGNHEMYSGGHAYFGTALKMFGQQASYFALENEHWLLVGLDTAYAEHSLYGDQISWLETIRRQRPKKKLVLLSHHQPFSLIESQGPELVKYLRLLLQEGAIHAWYFGHEHRCAIYDRHPDWKLAARCIGHGGMPYYRDTIELENRNGQRQTGANGSTWYRMNGAKLTQNESGVPGGLIVPPSLILDGPNPYLDDEAEDYGPHGYVALEFEGDRLFETFYLPTEPGPVPVEIIARRPV